MVYSLLLFSRLIGCDFKESIDAWKVLAKMVFAVVRSFWFQSFDILSRVHIDSAVVSVEVKDNQLVSIVIAHLIGDDAST